MGSKANFVHISHSKIFGPHNLPSCANQKFYTKIERLLVEIAKNFDYFRTLEYLMRHLAKVAEKGHETGMTPRNVAIVWAPNLLRCKELEVGGVAALQGVGVQAVVTEFLVCYADLIFCDRLPNISLPPIQGTYPKFYVSGDWWPFRHAIAGVLPAAITLTQSTSYQAANLDFDPNCGM